MSESPNPPAPLFAGHGGDVSAHHTVGAHRAWCLGCVEWCYPNSPCGQVRCCAEALVGLDDPEVGARYEALIARRDELILQGVDPAELLVPIKPLVEGPVAESAARPFKLMDGERLVALGAEFPDGAVAFRLADDGGWTTRSTGGVAEFLADNSSFEVVWQSPDPA